MVNQRAIIVVALLANHKTENIIVRGASIPLQWSVVSLHNHKERDKENDTIANKIKASIIDLNKTKKRQINPCYILKMDSEPY